MISLGAWNVTIAQKSEDPREACIKPCQCTLLLAFSSPTHPILVAPLCRPWRFPRQRQELQTLGICNILVVEACFCQGRSMRGVKCSGALTT